jgi:hypothetical protein
MAIGSSRWLNALLSALCWLRSAALAEIVQALAQRIRR